jgi:hypothetical protein
MDIDRRTSYPTDLTDPTYLTYLTDPTHLT